MTEIIQNNSDYVVGALIFICEISVVVIVFQFIQIKELKNGMKKPKIKKSSKEQLERLIKNAYNNSRQKNTSMDNIIRKIEGNIKDNKN